MMNVRAESPVPIPKQLRILPGPGVLADIGAGPSLVAHRARYGTPLQLEVSELVRLAERARLRGRGGAAFPFATKLRIAASGGRGKRAVVVNLSEGEPASAKDAALALTRPHLVLDGAAVAARALGCREVWVALPGERPAAADRMRTAIEERDDELRWRTKVGEDHFVAGQSRAVIELLGGRANKPVTSWRPEALDGHRGRPTLLSNAETWAHLGRLASVGLAAYAAPGTDTEPGTTLLTIGERGAFPTVLEVGYGSAWSDVLPERLQGRRYLVGGFHGTWATWEDLAETTVSIRALRAQGLLFGAGVVFAIADDECPVEFSTRVVDYLAGQSAGRCGPCLNGLPALAAALRAVSTGAGGAGEVERLSALVAGRGACAHPDGTVRLVRSLLSRFPREIAAHSHGECHCGIRDRA
jgi:NADH:ubiquinone oxidoreductase subunit F (NADH-binding)